jgi:hypothetical protein
MESDTPDAITKKRSFHAAWKMLSFTFLVRSCPLYTTELLMAAIRSAFLCSLVRPLSALSALEPPLKASLCSSEKGGKRAKKWHKRKRTKEKRDQCIFQ